MGGSTPRPPNRLSRERPRASPKDPRQVAAGAGVGGLEGPAASRAVDAGAVAEQQVLGLYRAAPRRPGPRKRCMPTGCSPPVCIGLAARASATTSALRAGHHSAVSRQRGIRTTGIASNGEPGHRVRDLQVRDPSRAAIAAQSRLWRSSSCSTRRLTEVATSSSRQARIVERIDQPDPAVVDERMERPAPSAPRRPR